MLFVLTESKQGQVVTQVIFPVNPESVQVQSAVKTQTFSPIEVGDISLPRGTSPYKVTFNGTLPGSPNRMPLAISANPVDPSDLGSWVDPITLVTQLDTWAHPERSTTAMGLLNFTITDSPCVVDCFIDSFTYTVQGGFGDIDFQISLTEARPLYIYAMGEAAPVTNPSEPPSDEGDQTPPDAPPETYYTNDDDSVYEIAKIQLGNTFLGMEIIDLNNQKSYPDGMLNPVDGSLMDPEHLPGGITLQLPTALKGVSPLG